MTLGEVHQSNTADTAESRPVKEGENMLEDVRQGNTPDMAKSRPVKEGEMTLGEVHQRNSGRQLQDFSRLAARYSSVRTQSAMLAMRVRYFAEGIQSDNDLIPDLESQILTCGRLYQEVLQERKQLLHLQGQGTTNVQNETIYPGTSMQRLDEQLTHAEGALNRALASQQNNTDEGDEGHEAPTDPCNHPTILPYEQLNARLQINDEQLMEMSWELSSITLQNLIMIPCQCADKQLQHDMAESHPVKEGEMALGEVHQSNTPDMDESRPVKEGEITLGEVHQSNTPDMAESRPVMQGEMMLGEAHQSNTHDMDESCPVKEGEMTLGEVLQSTVERDSRTRSTESNVLGLLCDLSKDRSLMPRYKRICSEREKILERIKDGQMPTDTESLDELEYLISMYKANDKKKKMARRKLLTPQYQSDEEEHTEDVIEERAGDREQNYGLAEVDIQQLEKALKKALTSMPSTNDKKCKTEYRDDYVEGLKCRIARLCADIEQLQSMLEGERKCNTKQYHHIIQLRGVIQQQDALIHQQDYQLQQRDTELQDKCARIGQLERNVQSYHTQLVDKLRTHGIATDKLNDEIKTQKQIIQQLEEQLAEWDLHHQSYTERTEQLTKECELYSKNLEKEQHSNYQQRRRHDKTIQELIEMHETQGNELKQDQEAFQVEQQSLKEELHQKCQIIEQCHQNLTVEKKRVKRSIVHMCKIGDEKKLLQAAIHCSEAKVQQIDCEKRKIEKRLSNIGQDLQKCITKFDEAFGQSTTKSQILQEMQLLRKHINFDVQVTPVDPRLRQQLMEKMREPNPTLYPMLSSTKGKCYIINIVNYTKENIQTRRGSEVDEWRLKALFSQIGFHVQSYRDLAHEELVSVLDKAQHERGNSFGLALLTHGTNGTVVAADGRKLHIEVDIKTRIRRVLPGKPKLLIIVACQKDPQRSEDMGHLQASNSTASLQGSDFVETSEHTVHLLTVYSTVFGYPSYRDPQLGTPFLQKFVDIFQEHCHNTEVGKLLRMLRGHIIGQMEQAGAGGKEDCTLTKEWFFLP